MPARRLEMFVLLLLCSCALIGSTESPPAQQTPTFRSAIDVVPLTVTVLDRNGAPVTDLKASDFTVLENKRTREILSFFPQRFVADPTPPASEAERTRPRNSSVAPETRRTFLITLGYGFIQHPTKALDGAIELVRKKLLPQDAVAVMGFHRATAFTTDHEQIAQILERYKKDHEKVVFDINEYRVMSRSPPQTAGGASGGVGGAPIPDSILRRIDAIFTGATPPATGIAPLDLRHTADLLLALNRAVPVVEKPWQRQETLAEIQRNLRNSGDDITDEVLLSTRLKLFAGVEYLRYLDGEKHMLFLANGGLARNADDAKVVAQRATDARVIVDLIATNGTNARGGGGGSRSGRDVAELTGGYYTSVEMATKAVAKIDQATRFSYLLGYSPSNPVMDGRYRDVEVRVNRPDLTVRYRHGYFAAPEPPPLELKDLIAKSRIEAALSFESEAKDIKLGVNASLLPRMGIQVAARVEITIDASKLVFALTDGVRTGDLEFQVYLGDAREALVGDFGERLELQASEETYAEWLKSGIRRVVRVPATGTPKYVKVVVYDYGSQRAGSIMMALK